MFTDNGLHINPDSKEFLRIVEQNRRNNSFYRILVSDALEIGQDIE
jgi:hypothetical protein